MTNQKAAPSAIAIKIHKQLTFVNKFIADITLTNKENGQIDHLANRNYGSQGAMKTLCDSIIQNNKTKWLKLINSELALTPISLRDLKDNNGLTNKLILGMAINAIGSTAYDFHEAELLFAQMHKEGLDSDIRESLSRGLDEIAGNLITDIQMLILGRNSPIASGRIWGDFDCIAALNNYVNAIAEDKSDVADTIKERAIIAINSAMTFASNTVTNQCIKNTFMSDELILGDDWNNPVRLTPENIINEPEFALQVKQSYHQALMQEVKVALADLQTSTDIKLDAELIPGAWQKGTILLKFDETQTYEVWVFQFDNIEQLRDKIMAMASNEISDIENSRNVQGIHGLR